MKLYGYEFENEGTVQFQPVSGVQFSDLNIDEYWTEYSLLRTFSDPQGNKVRYKAELTGTVLTYPRIHTLGATLS